MFLMKWQDNKKGISIIEILIVIVIIIIALGSLFALVTFSLRISTSIKENAQANNLAQETIEAVRNFRDGTEWDISGLGTLATSTAYHLEQSGDIPPKWQLILGEEIIGGFTRRVIFNEVYRDADDNIVEAGDTDLNTKKVTVIISWKDEEVEIVTYLTNWR